MKYTDEVTVQDTLSLLLDLLLPKSRREKEIEKMHTSLLVTKVDISAPLHNVNSVSLFNYQDPLVKDVIWALKYKGNKRVAELFAEVLHDYLLEKLSDRALFEKSGKPLFIPIPLSKERLRERGFNQMELVVNAFFSKNKGNLCVPSFSILQRIKNTLSQTRLQNREERRKNLGGAFCVADRDAVFGKDIVLLDDVITTGATMYEARKTLLEAGAKSVLCIGLAH